MNEPPTDPEFVNQEEQNPIFVWQMGNNPLHFFEKRIEVFVTDCVSQRKFADRSTIQQEFQAYFKRQNLQPDQELLAIQRLNETLEELEVKHFNLLRKHEPELAALMIQILHGVLNYEIFERYCTSERGYNLLVESSKSFLKSTYRIEVFSNSTYLDVFNKLKKYHSPIPDSLKIKLDYIKFVLLDNKIVSEENLPQFALNFKQSMLYVWQVMDIFSEAVSAEGYKEGEIQDHKLALAIYCALH